jgi:DNA-binding NtrC family response regulator
MNPKPKTVLVVDDDEGMRDTLNAILRRDYRVLRVATGEAALAILNREDVDLMLLDVRLPGIDGFDVLRIVKENYSLVEVIMISAITEIETAVRAMKFGAYHYTTKEFDYETIRSLVHNASERQDLNRQVMTLTAQVADQGDRDFVVGPSKLTRDIVDLVQKVAKLSATVLILGESGTGKELLARLIHRESGSADAPFIAVNLAAIPRELVESTLFGHERGSFTGALKQQLGKFELASSGTLFLDEIGDLPLELQAKLLRAIQEGEIERVGGAKPIKTDFRLIAATNVDLEKAVKEGRFREDLYYRINVIPIKMPPLRDRIDDLPELAKFFLNRYKVRFRKNIQGIADSTLQILSSYWWPGNIRELENLIERLVAVTDKEWITDEDLPFEFQHLRAQLHSSRTRKIRRQRDGHGALPRHSTQHPEVQDGPPRDPRARQEAPRSLKSRPISWPLRPTHWLVK